MNANQEYPQRDTSLLTKLKELECSDHYTRLELSPNASLADIKQAYKKLSLKYHPDKNSAKYADQIFVLIHDAYQTLCDSEKKIIYDHKLKDGIGVCKSREAEIIKGGFRFETSMDHIDKISLSNNFMLIFHNTEILLYYHSTGKLHKTIKVSEQCTTYYGMYISDRDYTVTAPHSSGDIDVFDIHTGKLTATYGGVNKASYISNVIYAENKRIICHDDSNIKILDNGVNTLTISVSTIHHVSSSKDGTRLVIASGKNAVKIYSTEDGEELKTIYTGFPVYHVEISPDGKYLAYGGYTDRLFLYEMESGKTRSIKTAYNEINCLNFSKDSQYLAIGEYTHGVAFYDIKENSIIGRYITGGYVKDVQFTDEGRLIVNCHYSIHSAPLPGPMQKKYLSTIKHPVLSENELGVGIENTADQKESNENQITRAKQEADSAIHPKQDQKKSLSEHNDFLFFDSHGECKQEQEKRQQSETTASTTTPTPTPFGNHES